MRLAVLGLVVVCLVSCVSSTRQVEAVTKRAKFDLECPQIQVGEIGHETFGAQGCGRRATYITKGCLAGEDYPCQAIMNSETTSQSPAARP